MLLGKLTDTTHISWTSNADALPATGGSYALKIELHAQIRLPLKFGAAQLNPGRYIYAGSAQGPGGIKARCTRHLSKLKSRRWHVDWLTNKAASVEALALPDTEECEIIRRLSAIAANTFPQRHFGSSDCRTCPAHLMETHLSAVEISTILRAV